MALNHLQAAHEYIAAENKDAAAELVGRILDAVEQLAQYPEMGRKGRIKDTRELVIVNTPFLVAYRVKHGEVQVLAVLHGSRRWPASF